MGKRLNDGSDGDESQDSNDAGVKRRKITFESVRLPAVSGVNDINNRSINYKAAKLAQQVKYKNMKIAELERENERLKRRQETDEENFYKIHRIGLDMESQVYNAMRSEIDSLVKLEGEDENLGTMDLLQLDSEQLEKQFGKQGERIIKFLQLLAQSRQKRVERQKTFSKKLIAFIENDPSTSADSATKELATFNQQISEENVKLIAENTRLQHENTQNRSKLRQKQDECEILQNKQEEILRELEDAKYETDKMMRTANKYETRLCSLAVELKTATENMASGKVAGSPPSSSGPPAKKMNGGGAHSNGSPGAVIDTVEVETIRVERDEQADLANRRLQEIVDLNTRIQKLSSEIVKLKSNEAVISSERIYNSEEYKNLKGYYSLSVLELEKKNKTLIDVIEERDRMRMVVQNRLAADRENQEKAQQKTMEVNEKTNKEYQALKHDYDILRTEFEQTIVQNNHTLADAKQADIRPIMSSLKTQNHVLKQEVAKYKKKWRDSVNHYSKTQREYDLLKKKMDNSLVLALDEFNKDDTLQSPEQSNDDAECSRNELIRLRSENEVMRKEMRAHGNADRAEKQRFFEKELQSNMSQKLAELERLRKDNERYDSVEKVLSEELESIGQALEELQEQNGLLISEKRAKEDQVLKLMNERILERSKNQKLHDENKTLIVMRSSEEATNTLLNYELKTLRSEIEAHTKNWELKTMENSKMTIALENNRKKLQDLGNSRDDLQIRYEKHESQLKHIQELLSQKATQLEAISHKRNRLEEETNLLRKKYERIQKSEKYGGSTDAVLVEENRQLKEILTCPSCKTKPKDCIMIKCHHFFCESCIKTRYDTRQRKCPKCNSGFGANDFHRVFF